MNTLLESIAGIRKAVVAALVGALVSWLGRKGFTLDVTVTDSIRTVIDAFLTGVVVWFVPNQVGAVSRKK